MSDDNVHCYHANYYRFASLERNIFCQESVEAIKNLMKQWVRTIKKRHKFGRKKLLQKKVVSEHDEFQ